jgi:hypothetical protein
MQLWLGAVFFDPLYFVSRQLFRPRRGLCNRIRSYTHALRRGLWSSARIRGLTCRRSLDNLTPGSTGAGVLIREKGKQISGISEVKSNMGSIFHSLLVIPLVGFVVAVGTGIVIRKRSMKEDERYRDLRFS